MDATLKRKVTRDEVKPGESLCDYCTAKCCHYFALPIDTPTRRKDYDYIRWFLLHERATVFIESGTWYLLVYTTCRHLRADHLCGIYLTRPQICRAYSTNKCEYDDDWVYEQYFETPEQIEEYMEVVLPRKSGQSIRSPKPACLPIAQ
jgi:Fe-S-cluster containining protein